MAARFGDLSWQWYITNLYWHQVCEKLKLNEGIDDENSSLLISWKSLDQGISVFFRIISQISGWCDIVTVRKSYRNRLLIQSCFRKGVLKYLKNILSMYTQHSFLEWRYLLFDSMLILKESRNGKKWYIPKLDISWKCHLYNLSKWSNQLQETKVLFFLLHIFYKASRFVWVKSWLYNAFDKF